MYDALVPPLQLMAGNVLLIGVLPFAVALGLGLVWLGLLRQRFAAVVGGIALAAGVAIIGMALRQGALNSPHAPDNLAIAGDSIRSFLPYSIGLAAVMFLVGLLPGIVRAHRAG